MPLKDDHVAGDAVAAADMNKIAKFINAILPVGVLQDFFGLESQVPAGMLACSGKTIGNASSNATARANADMEALFTHLWTVGNTDGSLSILTSAGAGSTYGADAATDWAANKAIALPDMRGRTAAGKDTMGGVDADRIVTNDAQGDKVGGVCGAENHTLTTAEMPSHSHTVQSYKNGGGSGSADINGEGGLVGGVTPSTSSTGGGGAHNTMQPTMFVTKIIWTGVTW